MIKKISLSILLMGTGSSMIAQQSAPEWFIPNSVSNSSYNFNGNPVAAYYPFYNYFSTATVIKDANNKGLFAIHNGVLLDELNWVQPDGMELDYDMGYGSVQKMVYYEALTNLTQFQKVKVQGFTECVPLPVPIGNGKVDCNRYYIIAAGYGFSRNWEYSGNGGLNFNLQSYEPYYSIVNMSTNNHDQYFEPLQMKSCINYPSSSSPSSTFPNLKCTALPMLELIPGLFTQNGSNQDAAIKSSNCFIAATKLRSDDSYFLFIMHNTNVYRFVVSTTGISYVNTVCTIPNASVNSLIPSEMEVTELSNGDYRIAIPYINSTTGNHTIRVCEVFGSGVNVGTLKSSPAPFDIALNNGGQSAAVLHGIEFSPLNNYLYFTHETNANNPNPIEYYNFIAGTRSALGAAPANKANFAKGFIEQNVEGGQAYLYFTSQDELTRLANPDVPTSATWAVLMNSASGYLNDPGSIESFVNPSTNPTGIPFYTATSYILPDYADKHNYMAGYQAGQCCLDYKAVFEIPTAYSFPTNNTYVITAGTTLPGSSIVVPASGILNVKGNITIPATTKVTFQNMTIRFAPNASLIVNAGTTGQQGGKLLLSGTTLTAYNDCDPNAMWPGVVLNGIDGIAQGSATNSQQPVLTASFSSQVDHALTAIKMDHGAIAQFANSRLYDNLVAVEATAYSFASATDVSLFSATLIKTLSTFNISTPQYLANIVDRVPAMRFQNCTFANEAVSYHNVYDGIISNNSAVTLTNSNFTRFRYAVRHSNTSLASVRKLKITNNTFNNNHFSVAVSTSDFAEITGSRFNIIDNTTTCQWPYGLLLDGSSKFKISGNTFNNFSLNVATVFAGSNPGGTTGLIAQNTNLYDFSVNIIEKNTFLKLHTGASSTGTNYSWNGSGTPHNINGLRYYCNIFQNNLGWFDMLINGGTIDYNQGVNTYRAQNQFSHSGTADIYAVSTTPNTSILYSHSGTGVYLPTVSPYPYILPQDLTSIVNTNDCSGTAVGSPGGRMISPDTDPQAYLAAIHDIETTMEQLKQGQAAANQEQLAFLKGQRDKWRMELVLYYLNDSSDSAQDSARKCIENMVTENNNPCQLISFYLDNGNLPAAKKAYGKLQASGAGANSMEVYGILIDLYGKDAKTELANNKDLFNQLQSIANDPGDREAYLISRWMINKVQPNAYTPDYTGLAPDESKGAITKQSPSGIYNLGNYPNPFTDQTTITAYIPEQSREAVIKITDVLGREMDSYQLITGKNTIDFNNQNSKGLLFYTLYIDGKQVETRIMMKNN